MISIEKKRKSVDYMIFFPIFLIAAYALLPFLLFGENCIVTVHDNLDCAIPWYKMFHDNGLFLKFDVPTKGFSGMSTLYYSHLGFNFQSLLCLIFPDFTAYTLSYYFSVLFAFVSMYILLKRTVGISSTISIFMAVCYALLPVGSLGVNIAVSTIPLFIATFFYFAFQHEKTFSWKSFLLLFFPFFSSFTLVGIFILGFWFLGLILFTIKDKKINRNLFFGFFMLCIGNILVDLRLFYVMFVLKTPLNRIIFDFEPVNLIRSLIKYCINGHYHAVSVQKNIIVPAAFIVSLYFFILLIQRIKEKTGNLYTRIKTVLTEMDKRIKLFFIFEILIVFFCFIAALCDSQLLAGFIRQWIPILRGFIWNRVFIFNRILWYIVFAFCLHFILQINITVNDEGFFKKVKMSMHSLSKLIAILLVAMQLGYVLQAGDWYYYNDQIKTWLNEIPILTKVVKKKDVFISYKEFFAKDLFTEIKEDISYSNERVLAFGYHPGVLMYNGFNCIDGYNNSYPLSYMQKFRTLIEPELRINQEARKYYDNWGGRMYLYNSELSYEPTRNKNHPPVKLLIDMEVFKNDFQGKYILSRAEIANSDILGLNLVNKYYRDESIYTIYVYKTH